MELRFTKHERIWLRHQSNFSESWLHNQISQDTSILGLGDLEVIDRERVQHGAGRLDMLLADSENTVRYEVEFMFEATDPSHIIRCIAARRRNYRSWGRSSQPRCVGGAGWH